MKVIDVLNTQIAVPLSKPERNALNALKAQGIQKGHWVAQAIREKLERDGLIGKEEG
jgi:hypothetical protein